MIQCDDKACVEMQYDDYDGRVREVPQLWYLMIIVTRKP